ncbi:hypothetical protein EYC58_02915 [Candidatus Saccharibacteria bacterium]|nr:MAG: hypothetical protein EYC58_02915 [Candidatus Saccharibacteria bacterium]
MQDLTDDERKQVLGEVLFSELRAIREALDDVPKRAAFNQLVEKVDRIGADVETIKLVVKDQSRQFQRHETEIAALKSL